MPEITIELGQHIDMVGRAFGAVADTFTFVAEAFFHFPSELGAVDELHLALTIGSFAVGDNPDISINARVVEKMVGQADDGIEHVIFDNPAADIALSTARITRKKRRAIEYDSDAGTLAISIGPSLHL